MFRQISLACVAMGVLAGCAGEQDDIQAWMQADAAAWWIEYRRTRHAGAAAERGAVEPTPTA